MFSSFVRLCQPRVLILAAIAIVAVLSVPGGRAAMTLVSRPVGGVSATPEPTATARAATASAAAEASAATAQPAAAAPAAPAATSKTSGSGVKTLFSDDFAADPLGCLGGLAGAVTQGQGGAAAAATGTVTGAVGSVTGAVDGVTGALPGTGAVSGTVSGAVSSATGSVAGVACSLTGAGAGTAGSGAAGGVVGSVTGTVDGVAGAVAGTAGAAGGITRTLPGGWVTDGSVVPAVVREGTHHVLAHVDRSWSFLVAGSVSWGDYSVSATVRTEAGVGAAGVAARYLDAKNYYACEIVNGTALRMVRMVAGEAQVLASGTPAAIATPGAFHTIAMVARGSSLACSLDGSNPLQAVDGALTHGRMALVGLDALPAEFGAVKVLSLPTA